MNPPVWALRKDTPNMLPGYTSEGTHTHTPAHKALLYQQLVNTAINSKGIH